MWLFTWKIKWSENWNRSKLHKNWTCSPISSWKLLRELAPKRTDEYANVHWKIKKNCGAWNWLISALCVSSRVKLKSRAPISKTLQNILYANKRHSASGLVPFHGINWWKWRGVILQRMLPKNKKNPPDWGDLVVIWIIWKQTEVLLVLFHIFHFKRTEFNIIKLIYDS